MSEKKVPADGKWYRATWPGDPNEEEVAEWTAVIMPPPDFDGYCEWCETKKATVLGFALNRGEVDIYRRCGDCRPVVAEEEGA
jgi:hypothetical protein